MTVPHLLTVRQFAQQHPAFPEGGLRHQIFHADSNGLNQSGALIRNGRRILIHEERFFEWLERRSQNSETIVVPPIPDRGVYQ